MWLFGAALLAQDYDLLIRGGTIVDGTGNPSLAGDVAVKDGCIAAVGRLSGGRARRTIEARGKVVAPGFIDIHNRSDPTLLLDGNAESMIRQGVTSMILGEGGSAAPLGGSQPRLAASALEISPGEASWSDFAGYFARLRKQGISTNAGSYVGSSQIWTFVRGPKSGPPSAADRAATVEQVRIAMRQGVLGVSSSLSGPPGS